MMNNKIKKYGLKIAEILKSEFGSQAKVVIDSTGVEVSSDDDYQYIYAFSDKGDKNDACD